MNHADLAQLCADIYNTTTGFTVYDCDGVFLGVREVSTSTEDSLVITFRGSANTEDWLDDFYSIPVKDPHLGTVHGGMFKGIPGAYNWLRNMLTMLPLPKTLVLTGHSLGGAHARLMAGLLVADGIIPASVVTFGSPKPGCAQLKTLVSKVPEHISYRHCEDVVPTLPPDIFGYLHTEPWVELGADPATGLLEPASDHSIKLYLQALSQP